jgi:hypothetical protein
MSGILLSIERFVDMMVIIGVTKVVRLLYAVMSAGEKVEWPHETSGDVTLPLPGLSEHNVSSWDEAKTDAVLVSAQAPLQMKRIAGTGSEKTDQKFQSRRQD